MLHETGPPFNYHLHVLAYANELSARSALRASAFAGPAADGSDFVGPTVDGSDAPLSRWFCSHQQFVSVVDDAQLSIAAGGTLVYPCLNRTGIFEPA